MREERLDNIYTEKRRISYTNADVIKLNTRCLYAGKLERVKKWQEKLHSHPFCEILFVFSGSGETVIDDRAYPIKKGDIIIYNRGTTHRESTSAQSGLEMGFFGITDFHINELPKDCLISPSSAPVISTGEDEERLRFYFDTLVSEAEQEEKYNELIAKYLARLILIDILRLADISEAKFVTNAIVSRIHSYVDNNFTTITTLDGICSELHVSRYYVSHVFKQYVGRSPMQYITEKRIELAKKLLQETDLTATEIGERCGYFDHALFFKAFKRVSGVTPMAFRASHPGTKSGGE